MESVENGRDERERLKRLYYMRLITLDMYKKLIAGLDLRLAKRKGRVSK